MLVGKDFSSKLNLFWWSAFADLHLGRTYFESGQYRKSYDLYLEAVSALEHIGLMPTFVNLLKILAARSEEMMAGNTDLDKVYQWYHENNFRLYDGWMPRYIADILGRMDGNHPPEAESWIKKAIEADTENEMMLESAKSEHPLCRMVQEERRHIRGEGTTHQVHRHLPGMRRRRLGAKIAEGTGLTLKSRDGYKLNILWNKIHGEGRRKT